MTSLKYFCQIWYDSVYFFISVTLLIPLFLFKVHELNRVKICQKCSDDINAVYKFRNKCIEGISAYKNYMNNLLSDSASKEVTNDVSKDVDLESYETVPHQEVADSDRHLINVCSINVKTENEFFDSYDSDHAVPDEEFENVTQDDNNKETDHNDKSYIEQVFIHEGIKNIYVI